MQQNRDTMLELLGIARASPVRIHFFELLGRANVVVDEGTPIPQPAIVRRASRESGWDVDVFAAAEYERHMREAIATFTSIARIDAALAEKLVALGYRTLGDLSVIDPADFTRLGGFDMSTVDDIISDVDRRCIDEHFWA